MNRTRSATKSSKLAQKRSFSIQLRKLKRKIKKSQLWQRLIKKVWFRIFQLPFGMTRKSTHSQLQPTPNFNSHSKSFKELWLQCPQLRSKKQKSKSKLISKKTLLLQNTPNCWTPCAQVPSPSALPPKAQGACELQEI